MALLSHRGPSEIGRRAALARALEITPTRLVTGLLDAGLLQPQCCAACRDSSEPGLIAELTERWGGDAWMVCIPKGEGAANYAESLLSPARDIVEEHVRLDSGLSVVLLAVARLTVHEVKDQRRLRGPSRSDPQAAQANP